MFCTGRASTVGSFRNATRMWRSARQPRLLNTLATDLMSNPLETGKKALNVKVHAFRSERIHYLDNSLGFGTLFSLRLENGKHRGAKMPVAM
jgi:hypothetical protein